MHLSSIVERIKRGAFWQFPGGVHPDGKKALSNTSEIKRLPLANKFYIPVKQHVGTGGSIAVKPGDAVLKGQPLTASSNPFAVPVHAPTSGEIVSVKQHVSAHPSGFQETTIVLKADGKDRWVDLTPTPDYQSMSRVKLVEQICEAGISGMGGAGFPTHIKLSASKEVDFLVINGVECEPYITSDDRLMQEHAWQIRQGVEILQYMLAPKNIIVAVEDNKPDAFAAMKIAFQDSQDILLCQIPTKYPAGGEKQLIQVLTGREVPSGKLPIDVGTLMYNVATCFAVADAICAGKPLLERVVTLTGDALETPGNAWVPLGTPIQHLLQHAGYQRDRQLEKHVIMGGPMMGFTVHSELVPIIKTSNCILVPSSKEMATPGEENPCIRCGACADACPAGLLPQQLYWHTKGGELDKANELNLFDCIECGACAFVCPSEIPLVHYYRTGKAQIRIEEEEKHKADKARERFEARSVRLERDKQERQEKAAAAAEARKQRTNSNGDTDNKSRVAAALARAKANKASSDTNSTEPEINDAGDNNSKVAAAIARAKAKRQAAQHSDSTGDDNVANPDTSVDAEASSSDESPTSGNKDRVAAAIARAKAKKQAQQKSPENTESADQADTDEQQDAQASPEDQSAPTQKDRVAAAIARAKAKKLAQQHEAKPETPTEPSEGAKRNEDSDNTSNGVAISPVSGSGSETSESLQAETSKTDRVAAAVARAKAKKLAREKATQEQDTELNTESSPDEQSPTEEVLTETPELDKAEVAAEDIAKSISQKTEVIEPAEDNKQDRIAAAIARAKAKKAARQQASEDNN